MLVRHFHLLKLVRICTLVSTVCLLPLIVLGGTCMWMILNLRCHHWNESQASSGPLQQHIPFSLESQASSVPLQQRIPGNDAKLPVVPVSSSNDMVHNTGGGPPTKESMIITESDLKERQRCIQEVCAKYGLGSHVQKGVPRMVKYPPKPHYNFFFFDRRHELAWCPIFKAASTNWMHYFSLLGGLTEAFLNSTKEQPNVVARRLWPRLREQEAVKAFKFCLKFMIVRHPFERLVSAFRDKLENVNVGLYYITKYGRKIVSKYRKGGIRPLNAYSSDQNNPALPPPKGTEPTFDEFVKYLIDTDPVYADPHWMPYYLYCTPCSLQYDVIVKFETLDRDQNYIIQQKGLQNLIHPSWMHMTKGLKSSTSALKYFANVPRSDVMRLYEKYKVDFEMFNYSMDEYLLHALHDEA